MLKAEAAAQRELQDRLLQSGQHIPNLALRDANDLAQSARISASSEYRLARLPPGGPLIPLTKSWAQMLPLPAGRAPKITLKRRNRSLVDRTFGLAWRSSARAV